MVCPAKGTLTTQYVVTVPVLGSSTISSVATPSVGHEPREGVYTFWHFGQRWPMNLPCSKPCRFLLCATPGVKT